MGIAFKQFFASLTVLLISFSKLAGALNFLAAWAEETAGAFYDEAAADRANKRRESEAASGITIQATPVAPVISKAKAKELAMVGA